MSERDMMDEAVVAALVAGARLGLPTDTQGFLLRGDPARGVAPGILRAMLEAAISEHLDNLERVT